MKSQPKEKAFASMATEEAEEWLNKDPKVSPMYQSFLKKFGHRCLREVGVIEYFFYPSTRDAEQQFHTDSLLPTGRGTKREREERDRERQREKRETEIGRERRERQREAERDTLTHKACTQRKREKNPFVNLANCTGKARTSSVRRKVVSVKVSKNVAFISIRTGSQPLSSIDNGTNILSLSLG